MMFSFLFLWVGVDKWLRPVPLYSLSHPDDVHLCPAICQLTIAVTVSALHNSTEITIVEKLT